MNVEIEKLTPLKILVAKLGMTQTSFAVFVGAKKNTFHNYYHGQRKIPAELVNQICEKFPNVNAGWLITGEGEMFKDMPNPETPQSETAQENAVLRDEIAELKKEILKMTEDCRKRETIETKLLDIIENLSKKVTA